MKRTIYLIAAVCVGAMPAAFAECPTDNHQQLFEVFGEVRAAGTNTDNQALMSKFRDNYARCPDDYQGLGFIGYLMSAVITNETDPGQALDQIAFTFQLLRRMSDIYDPKTQPFTYVDETGATQTIFTFNYALNTLNTVMLPKLVTLGDAGHADPGLIGQSLDFCPYGKNAGGAPEKETDFWVRLTKQSARLGTLTLLNDEKYKEYIAQKPVDVRRFDFAKNRLAALATTCSDHAPVFLKGRAKVLLERVEELETEIFTVEDALKENYYLPMDRRPDKAQLATLEQARKQAAILTVNAYRAFYAAKLATKSDVEFTTDEDVEFKVLANSVGMGR